VCHADVAGGDVGGGAALSRKGNQTMNSQVQAVRAWISRPRLAGIVGAVLLLTLLVEGALALTPQVTHDDLRVDTQIAALRFPAGTAVAIGLTDAAQEAVGLGALAVTVVVLLVRRRRWDAARLLGMAGAAWALALVVKQVFDRPRPPANLWALAPDASASFPSGHTTTAAVIVLILTVLAQRLRRRARITVLAAGVVYALAVGASRLYLGDHYPTDVAASYLTVAAAVLLAWTVTALPRVRHLAARVLRIPDIAPSEAESLLANVSSEA
jgi:undecaprenyl-diphosphatase